MTSDAIAAEKDPRIKPQSKRQQDILDWSGNHPLSTHILEDSWGPAPTRVDATHIACTPETRVNCEKINQMRIDGGLSPLEIIEVDHVLAEDGQSISSSRIRPGSIVGDVTVNALLEIGWVPDVGIVDGLTKRTAWDGELDRSSFRGQLSCENPPGQLTPDLLESADLALDFAFSEDGGPVLLEVEGEEDLAPIVIHLLAPLGTVVLYGQPASGVVLRLTDESTKARCRTMLDSFEVR